MSATAILMNEIEKLPEKSVAEVLDFVLFLRSRKSAVAFRKARTVSVPSQSAAKAWTLPKPTPLGKFRAKAEDWRELANG